jgi:tumor protein p53-inducible protein 3
MRAVLARQPGGVEVLEIVDMPRPEPGPEDLLVRNFAAGLNRADLLQRRGLYPPPPGDPDILGLEFAGEVAAAGAAACCFQRGDRVFGLVGGGAYAEFLTVNAALASKIPDNLSFDAAAAVPEAFCTANESLFKLGKLAPGEIALVHAGASGVGSAAIQLASARGATVVATAGSPEKASFCKDLGAERAVVYKTDDFTSAVMDVSDGRGADVIIDLVGATHWERNLASLREGGRLIVVGILGGARVNLDLSVILHRRIQVIGTALRRRSRHDKIAITERFQQGVLPLLEAGRIRPVLDRVFPLEEVKAAHERMEANLNSGKIILRM